MFLENLTHKMGAKSGKEKRKYNEEGVDDDHEDSGSHISESERRVNALLGANAPSGEEGDTQEREGVSK